MLRDSWYAKRWRDKAFQIHNFPAFHPVQTRVVQWWGGAWFVVLLSCSSAGLWGVIATMAAQAWGRAKHLGTAASVWVALGSSWFMLSDTLLALDKFVSPLPSAGLWVLASYYLAQGLIVRGVLRISKN